MYACVWILVCSGVASVPQAWAYRTCQPFTDLLSWFSFWLHTLIGWPSGKYISLRVVVAIEISPYGGDSKRNQACLSRLVFGVSLVYFHTCSPNDSRGNYLCVPLAPREHRGTFTSWRFGSVYLQRSRISAALLWSTYLLRFSASVFSLVLRALSVSVYVCLCVYMCSIALFSIALLL